MNKKIGLVLPAFNEEATVIHSLDNVLEGIMDFSQYQYIIFTIDDGSSDNTTEAICDWSHMRDIENINSIVDISNVEQKVTLVHHKNEKNKGLVQTLKESYARAIYFGDVSYVLKTDLDADFNQKIVLQRMLPFVEQSVPLVAGIRWRRFTREENPYEYLRRSDIIAVMGNNLSPKLCLLDPPSAGSQLYKASVLDYLLQTDEISLYDKHWGLDFLIPIVAAAHSIPFEVINIEDGKYDPQRRSGDKVKKQYDIYIDIIAKFIDESPTKLSAVYNMDPKEVL